MDKLNKEDLDALVDLVVGINQVDWHEKSLVLRLVLALSENKDDDIANSMNAIHNCLRSKNG